MGDLRKAEELVQDLLKKTLKHTQGGLKPSKKERCPICDGMGYVWEDYKQYPRLCKCEMEKNRKSNQEAFFNTMNQSRYKKYTFSTFERDEKWAEAMYKKVMAYCDQKGVYNLLLLGQPGSGKTHLAVAAFRYRMERGAKGEYLDFVSFMRSIKQHIQDDEFYDEIMTKAKKADILLIDDFLKGAKADNLSDVKIVFDLVNERYKADLPTIVTSEYFLPEIGDFDEATMGRLKEQAIHDGRDYVIQIGRNKDRDYRLKGVETL